MAWAVQLKSGDAAAPSREKRSRDEASEHNLVQGSVYAETSGRNVFSVTKNAGMSAVTSMSACRSRGTFMDSASERGGVPVQDPESGCFRSNAAEPEDGRRDAKKPMPCGICL